MIAQLLALAQWHQASGRAIEAEALYRRALDVEPEGAAIHRALGTALEDQGRTAEAVACYSRCLTLSPDDADGWCDLGMALRRLTRAAEAVPAYRRAVRLDPGFVEAWFNLGNALTALGRFDEAISAYRAALARRSDDAEVWCNLGNALHQRGRIGEAAAAARRAVACRPDHAASLEPGELKCMVAGIRTIEAALGTPDKAPAAEELANRAVARRSVVAARPIRAGEPVALDALACKRPGTGLSPMRIWELVGRPARRDFAVDEQIEP